MKKSSWEVNEESRVIKLLTLNSQDTEREAKPLIKCRYSYLCAAERNDYVKK